MKRIKKGHYKHYKGTSANVIGVALHSETKAELVIYEHVDHDTGENTLWARPATMFLETVTIGGKQVPRFQFIGEE